MLRDRQTRGHVLVDELASICASCHLLRLSIIRNEKASRVAISRRSQHSVKETKGKDHVYGSQDKHRVRFSRQMVTLVRCKRYRQKHSCDAASAQYRAGGRNRQTWQLCRADLEQSDQVSIRGRSLSGQFKARNHLGRSLLQGFRQPAGQARSCAGAGAGTFRGSGDPRRRGRRRPLGDHRYVRLQRIAGR